MDSNPTDTIKMETETHQEDTIAKSKEAEVSTMDSDTQLLKKQGPEKAMVAAGAVHNGEHWHHNIHWWDLTWLYYVLCLMSVGFTSDNRIDNIVNLAVSVKTAYLENVKMGQVEFAKSAH